MGSLVISKVNGQSFFLSPLSLSVLLCLLATFSSDSSEVSIRFPPVHLRQGSTVTRPLLHVDCEPHAMTSKRVKNKTKCNKEKEEKEKLSTYLPFSTRQPICTASTNARLLATVNAVHRQLVVRA